MPVLLTLTVSASGDLACSLGAVGRAPVTQTVPALQVATLHDTTALHTPPAFLIPGEDLDQVEDEEAWGQRASALLFGSPQLAVVMGRALSSAESPTPLVLRCDDDTLADLPWELLADPASGAGLERSGQAVLCRLVPAPTVHSLPTPGQQLRVLTWAPAADDPAIEDLLQAHDQTHRDTIRWHRLSDDLQELPPPIPGTVDILHLVFHGRREFGRLRLMLGSGSRAGETTRGLLPLLQRSALVLLDVCHGGMSASGSLGGLARELVGAGAGACIATGAEVAVDAASTFARGLLSKLAEGATLVEAANEARRRVAVQAIGHPNARWHNHRLLVADTAWLSAPLVEARGWEPAELPPGLPPAPQLWSAVHFEAQQMGFVGIEAVARALVRHSDGAASGELASTADLLDFSVAGLSRTAQTDALPTTPRLAEFLASLRHVRHVQNLCERLEHGLYDAVAPSFLGPVSTHSSTAMVLELVGGPECGRRLQLEVGDQIARWSPDRADPTGILLFRETAASDLGISRRGVASITAPGVVSALRRPIWVQRWDGASASTHATRDFTGAQARVVEVSAGAATEVFVGDEIWLSARPRPGSAVGLGPITRLRVRAVPPAPSLSGNRNPSA